MSDKFSDCDEDEDSFLQPLICCELFGNQPKQQTKSIQTSSSLMRDAQMQTSPEQQPLYSSRFRTPERKVNAGFVSGCQKLFPVEQQEERIQRLLQTPELFTPKMIYRSPPEQVTVPRLQTQCSDKAQIIGRDQYQNLHHLEISHKKLDEMYKDILPSLFAQMLSKRQIDAFQLYLFSYDLQFIY